ncbi:MAG: ComEC/Rec2 family competence protein [Roseburia hominis]
MLSAPAERTKEREKEHGRRAEQKSGGHPGVFLAALLLLAVLGVPRSGEAELDMLDVGQGDGCYLQTKEGYHLFVDGGSSNVGKVGTYRILPFLKYKGVKKIDCWVVSHTDEDHISGLREILSSGYPVEYLAVAEQMPRDENWEELEALAEDAGAKVVWLGRGDIWHFGKATFTALHPGEPEDAFGGQSVDKNEESLVLFIRRMTLPVSLPEILERRRKRRF